MYQDGSAMSCDVLVNVCNRLVLSLKDNLVASLGADEMRAMHLTDAT